jgi:hypothetical protein
MDIWTVRNRVGVDNAEPDPCSSAFVAAVYRYAYLISTSFALVDLYPTTSSKSRL